MNKNFLKELNTEKIIRADKDKVQNLLKTNIELFNDDEVLKNILIKYDLLYETNFLKKIDYFSEKKELIYDLYVQDIIEVNSKYYYLDVYSKTIKDKYAILNKREFFDDRQLFFNCIKKHLTHVSKIGLKLVNFININDDCKFINEDDIIKLPFLILKEVVSNESFKKLSININFNIEEVANDYPYLFENFRSNIRVIANNEKYKQYMYDNSNEIIDEMFKNNFIIAAWMVNYCKKMRLLNNDSIMDYDFKNYKNNIGYINYNFSMFSEEIVRVNNEIIKFINNLFDGNNEVKKQQIEFLSNALPYLSEVDNGESLKKIDEIKVSYNKAKIGKLDSKVIRKKIAI